jgi:hypothetical protein
MKNLFELKKPLILGVTVAVTFLSLTIFFIALVLKWMGTPDGSGAGFCEAPHDGLIVQPFNTWSNLSFIMAGLLISYELSSGKFDSKRNKLTKGEFYGAFFSSLAVLLGPGSMALHATTTKVGGFFDMLSMYMVASFTFTYALERFFNLKPLTFIFVFASVIATCLYMQTLPYDIPVVHYMGNFMFALFIFLTVVFEALNSFVRRLDHELKWGILSLCSLLTAFLIWNLSLSSSPFCDPSALIQGHGIWHILNAVAVYFLFRYYVSEHKY